MSSPLATLPQPGVGTNPLDGRPLEAWQVLVTGPAITGPRQTVVDTRPGAVVPVWIDAMVLPDGGSLYVDNGALGGTYDGISTLPDLTVNGANLLPLVVLGLVVLGAWGLKRARGSREWR